MPTYEFICKHKHRFEKVLAVADYNIPQTCDCGEKARRILSVPKLVQVQPDIRYDSPIDGKIIGTWKERQEDLARNCCSPYDPEIKKDFHRNCDERQNKLEKSFDETIEREYEKMPSAKREMLANELEHGITAEPIRATPKTGVRND